jgi:hypothetical protein
MIYAIPVVGWLIGLFFTIWLAVPFWFLWTVLGFGEAYFYWLPLPYRSIGFWDCVGLAIVISILKAVLLPHWGSSSTSESKGK